LLLFVTSSAISNSVQVGRGYPPGEVTLRHVPQAERDASLAETAPPLLRPDAVNINEDIDKDIDEDIDDHDGEDAEEDERGSSSYRWVSGSGPPECFVMLWAPCGPLAPPVPVGDRGRPLFFPGLP
jgi:hypothetical protein